MLTDNKINNVQRSVTPTKCVNRMMKDTNRRQEEQKLINNNEMSEFNRYNQHWFSDLRSPREFSIFLNKNKSLPKLATTIQNIPPSKPNVNRHKKYIDDDKIVKLDSRTVAFINRTE
jgi:hypothetical protein